MIKRLPFYSTIAIRLVKELVPTSRFHQLTTRDNACNESFSCKAFVSDRINAADCTCIFDRVPISGINIEPARQEAFEERRSRNGARLVSRLNFDPTGENAIRSAPSVVATRS